MSEVWLVWEGEYEALLDSIHATQQSAERRAHEIRKDYGWKIEVSVEGPKEVLG